MQLVDSHCHLDRIDLNKENIEFSQLMKNAEQANVANMLCVAISLDQIPKMMATAQDYQQVAFSAGVHPLHVGEDTEFSINDLADIAGQQRVVAVGETGLDYYYSKDTVALQQEYFAKHIEVANQLDKPLIVHTRDAREDTIAILKENRADKCRGVLHCFTESWEMAEAAMELGFYISISGIVTFKKAVELQEVVKKLPIERLLIETDSPYLAPVPYRGKQNQPAYVKHVGEFIAQLKGVEFETLAEITTNNYFSLFNTANNTAKRA